METYQGDPNYIRTVYEKFDLSAIPTNAIISSAIMELFGKMLQAVEPPADHNAYRVTSDWGEMTLTFNNKPSYTTTGLVARGAWQGNDQYQQWDITAFTQAWLSGSASNYGLMLHRPTFLAYRHEFRIRTKEWENANERPKLTVTWAYPAPDPPTNLSPSSNARINANQNNNFTWTHNGHGDTQGAYQLQIFRVSDGALIVDTGKVVSATSQHTIVAATLANGVNYQWKGKTWNSADLESSYSSLASFYTSQSPVVSITDPPDEGVYNKGLLTVTWDYSDLDSDPQNRYRAILMDEDEVVLEDSGEVVNANTSHEFATPLETDIVYQVSVQVWDTTDQSGSDLSVFTADFQAPATPLIEVTINETYINIDITNPDPVGEEPTVLYNHLYRREAGETTWQRIIAELPVNGEYDDYAVASEIVYEYRVVAVGENLTAASSTVQSASITLLTVYLHPVSDPTAIIPVRITARSISIDYDRVQIRYQGRTRPVSEFGIMREVSIPIKSVPLNTAALDAFVALADRREVFCYRDTFGRKEFVTMAGVSITDIKPMYHEFSATLDGVSYSEVV